MTSGACDFVYGVYAWIKLLRMATGCQFRLHIIFAQETVVAVRAACHSGVDSSAKADLYRMVRISQESHGILIGAQTLQAGEPHSFQWGTLYRSLTVGVVVFGNASHASLATIFSPAI